MAELYKEEPAYVLKLLNGILEDRRTGRTADYPAPDDQGLRRSANRGRKKANLNPTQLYRTLSVVGNPELRSLCAILKAMGLRLAVERVKAA